MSVLPLRPLPRSCLPRSLVPLGFLLSLYSSVFEAMVVLCFEVAKLELLRKRARNIRAVILTDVLI
jgi:hypothetical protein